MAKNNSDDNGANASGKMFSEETVAVLLMSFGTVSISTAQYEIMSAFDGKKTASSFQHQFRSVLKLAKELKTRVDNGEKFNAVAPVAKRTAADAFGDKLTTPPTTPKKQKATAKPRARKVASPPKKKKSVSPAQDDDGSSDGQQMVKKEVPVSDDEEIA